MMLEALTSGILYWPWDGTYFLDETTIDWDRVERVATPVLTGIVTVIVSGFISYFVSLNTIRHQQRTAKFDRMVPKLDEFRQKLLENESDCQRFYNSQFPDRHIFIKNQREVRLYRQYGMYLDKDLIGKIDRKMPSIKDEQIVFYNESDETLPSEALIERLSKKYEAFSRVLQLSLEKQFERIKI